MNHRSPNDEEPVASAIPLTNRDRSTMKLAVKLFARAKDLAGAGQVTIELPEPATVGGVRAALTKAYPALGPIASRLLIAVGTDYASDNQPLTADSDVACFPPVSGG